jgi:hypothetical protein
MSPIGTAAAPAIIAAIIAAPIWPVIPTIIGAIVTAPIRTVTAAPVAAIPYLFRERRRGSLDFFSLGEAGCGNCVSG